MIVILLVVVGLVVGIFFVEKDWSWLLIVPSVIILFVVYPIVGFTSYYDAREAEVFYHTNYRQYVSTVDMTQEALYALKQSDTLNIPVENLGQSSNWSDRIAELRDSVVMYNRVVYKLRRYNKNIFLSLMFANVSNELKFIEIEE